MLEIIDRYCIFQIFFRLRICLVDQITKECMSGPGNLVSSCNRKFPSRTCPSAIDALEEVLDWTYRRYNDTCDPKEKASKPSTEIMKAYLQDTQPEDS